MTSLAGLWDSLSNLSPPLLRVLEMYEEQRRTGKKYCKFDTTRDIIAQTGGSDLTVVRLNVKENHKLSAAEIDELACANTAGTSQRELAHDSRFMSKQSIVIFAGGGRP